MVGCDGLAGVVVEDLPAVFCVDHDEGVAAGAFRQAVAGQGEFSGQQGIVLSQKGYFQFIVLQVLFWHFSVEIMVLVEVPDRAESDRPGGHHHGGCGGIHFHEVVEVAVVPVIF